MVEQGLVGNEVEVVAVGDLVPADNLAYLLKYCLLYTSDAADE